MKTFALKSTLLGLILSFSVVAQAAIVHGNGTITAYKYEVPTYSQLYVDGNFDVILAYGTHASVTVTTDENLQDAVLIDNDGTTLYIRTKENTGNATQMKLYITVNNLQQMGFKDVTSVTSSGVLWFKSLDLMVNTLGSTKLQLVANKLNATIEGAGDLYLSGTVDEVIINNNGLGSVYTEDLSNGKLTLNHKGNRSVEMKVINDKQVEMKMLPVTPQEKFPKA
jgi:hypothetical protein